MLLEGIAGNCWQWMYNFIGHFIVLNAAGTHWQQNLDFLSKDCQKKGILRQVHLKSALASSKKARGILYHIVFEKFIASSPYFSRTRGSKQEDIIQTMSVEIAQPRKQCARAVVYGNELYPGVIEWVHFYFLPPNYIWVTVRHAFPPHASCPDDKESSSVVRGSERKTPWSTLESHTLFLRRARYVLVGCWCCQLIHGKINGAESADELVDTDLLVRAVSLDRHKRFPPLFTIFHGYVIASFGTQLFASLLFLYSIVGFS